MADELVKKRITEYGTEVAVDELDNSDVIFVDSTQHGTRKLRLKGIRDIISGIQNEAIKSSGVSVTADNYATTITNVNDQPVNTIYAYAAGLQSSIANLPSNVALNIMHYTYKYSVATNVGQVMIAIERSGENPAMYFRTTSGTPVSWGSWVKMANNADVEAIREELDNLDIETDTTLSISGKPADAKATGDEIDNLKADLNEINPIFSDYFETEQHAESTTNTMQWTSSEYYKLDTGEIASANSSYSHTEKFTCEAGDIIEIGATTGQVLFWSVNSYLSYVATSPSTAMAITAPNGSAFYACNNRNVNNRPTETTVTKTWTEKVLKVKEFNAPAQILYTSEAFVNKNYASTANGNLYTGDSYATWHCAYKIPCKPSHKYRTTMQTQVCFYNSSGTFISSYVPAIDGVNCSGVKVEMDFITPSGCEYFSINSNSANEIVFDMEYKEYENVKSVYPLIGKTVVCFGDSITGNYYFGDNYPYQIEEKTGAKVYDVGFGGCRMELSNDANINYINPFSMVSLVDAVVSDASDKWSTQDANVSSFAANRVVLLRLDILKSIDFGNVDIVTIAYGTNGLENPIENTNDPLDKYSYAGATRYAVKTLLTKYPHLRIVLLTPIYRWYNATSDDGDTHVVNGHTLLQRVNKLLEVGNEVKLPTIDLYHTLGINKYNYTGYFGDEDESVDGTHINSFGREQMGLRIGGELIRMF